MNSMLPPKTPSFFKIMFTDFDKNMRIPRAFMKNFREGSDLRIPNIIKLKCAGKTRCIATERRKDGCFLVSGWHKFAKECNLEFGDFLVFRLVEKSVLEVDVYGTSCCEKVSPFAKNDGHKHQAPVEKPEEVIPGKGIAGKRRKAIEAAETEGCSVKRARKAPKKMDASFEITLNHGNSKYQILLQSTFARETGMKQRENVVVKDPKGRKWPIKITVQKIGSTLLSTGWKKVWVANGLQIGDTIFLKFNSKEDEIELKIPSGGRLNSGDSVKRERKLSEKETSSESKGSSSLDLELKPYNSYKLVLPNKFARETGLRWKKEIVIKDPEGKTWTVRIYILGTEQTHLATGWKDLWAANRLEAGDTILLKFNHATGRIDLEIVKKGGRRRPNSGATVRKEAKIPKEEEMEMEINGSSSVKLVIKHYTTFKINLPKEFARENGLMSKKTVVVKNPEGRKWTIGVLVSREKWHVLLSAGWKEFLRGNGFEIGTEFLLKKSIHGADNEFDIQVLYRPNSNPEP